MLNPTSKRMSAPLTPWPPNWGTKAPGDDWRCACIALYASAPPPRLNPKSGFPEVGVTLTPQVVQSRSPPRHTAAALLTACVYTPDTPHSRNG